MTRETVWAMALTAAIRAQMFTFKGDITVAIRIADTAVEAFNKRLESGFASLKPEIRH